MIKIIYGAKGSGKTKKLIDLTNAAAEVTKGSVIYLTDNPKHSIQINTNVRFINTAEYGINNQELIGGFIKGIFASNSDITEMFIDGFARMADMNINDMEDIYKTLYDLSQKENVKIYLTVSADVLPEFMKKYV